MMLMGRAQHRTGLGADASLPHPSRERKVSLRIIFHFPPSYTCCVTHLLCVPVTLSQNLGFYPKIWDNVHFIPNFWDNVHFIPNIWDIIPKSDLVFFGADAVSVTTM